MNGCPFDNEFQIPVSGINSTSESCYVDAAGINTCPLSEVCPNNIDNFVCPTGYVKLSTINEKNINCEYTYQCQPPCFYQFAATNLCTYAQPTMDEETMANCCSSYVYSVGAPQCQTGYCSQNTSSNAPCIQEMTDYCSKYGPNNTNCINFIKNTANQTARESILQTYFNTQLKQGNKVTNPYNSKIAELCNEPDLKLGPLCDQLLNVHCKGITGREEIFKNPDFARLCGCHLDSSVYILSSFDQNGACDPICNLQNTVKNGAVGNCNQNVCIFDLDVINVIIDNGQINVNQLCGTNNNNRCYFSKDTISKIEKYKDVINFTSNCETCFSYDPSNIDNTIQKINCFESPPGGLSTLAKITIGVVGFTFIVGILLLVLL
jgi:hypothetical protein